MKKITITLTLDKELLEKLDAVAKKELRSRNNLIEKIVTDFVEKYNKTEE
ncbi:MAG: ribbon-helix-helix protein, CopG family [Paraclostridium sp.]